MENWDFMPHEEIAQSLKEAGVKFFDFSTISDDDRQRYGEILQEIEYKARNDEAEAIAKASTMRLYHSLH